MDSSPATARFLTGFTLAYPDGLTQSWMAEGSEWPVVLRVHRKGNSGQNQKESRTKRAPSEVVRIRVRVQHEELLS